VTLGTNYQTRLLTINPAPPAGTLQTSDEYNITVSNGTAEHDLNIPTRFLVYQPGYNEITVGPTQYEHSVLYLDERDRGNNVSIIEEQNLVKDETVRITALQNVFQQTGTNRVTLELYPQNEVNANDFPDTKENELNVTIPTRLDEDEYWDDALEDADDIYQGVDSGSSVNRLNLSVNSSHLEVNTIGIRQEPNEGPAKNTGAQTSGGTSDDSSVTDDESLSFDGLPSATSDQDGNDITEVEFEFGISNPDDVDYELVFGVQNQDGERSKLGPVTRPISTQSVTGGDALPNQMSGGGGGENTNYLDVEIILRNEDGSVVDTRSGRIESRSETIELT